MAKFELSEQSEQPVLSIRARTTLAGLPALIGESYTEIGQYLGEIGESPAGAPFTAYRNMDMQDLDVEMGFPLSKPLPGRGDIVASQLPHCTVAATMYRGPYSGIEQTYTELLQWIGENGREPSGVFYEYYYNSPAEVPESELLTRVVIPLK